MESLRSILLPISGLYAGVVSVRNFAYDNDILGVQKLPVPVVSVGNVSVGGSGKTPFVVYLVRKLLAAGRKPSVLSRGYKRLAKDLVISCPAEGEEQDVQMLGDEPALISMLCPEIPVAVHSDRHRSGLAVLEKHDVDVFILDDGFQNRELHRDLDFVLMKRSLRDLTDHYLPAGDLRDSRRRIGEGDVIVLTAHHEFSYDPEYLRKLESFSKIPVAGISYFASGLRDHAGMNHPMDIMKDSNAVAFCGIADPEQFFESARALGANVIRKKSFSDHHWYDEYDIDEVFGGDEDIFALTTLKDAVRIFKDEELSQLDEVKRIYAISESAHVNFGEEHIERALEKIFERAYA